MSLNRSVQSLALLLALTLALWGCGKKDPEPTTQTSALKAAASPEAAAPAADAPEKAGETPAADSIAAKAPLAGKAPVVSRLKLPDDVVAVLAFKSLDSVLNSAKTAIELLDPTNAQPGFISAAKEGIKESLGWKDIAWIQADKPIRTMIFNAKDYEGKAQFLALPMADKDAVLAALPDGARQKEGAHVAKYDNNGQTVFVDFIEGHAVYTDHESFFEKGKAFFEAQLRGWEPTREVELKLDLDNIYALFLPELSEAKRQLLATYSEGQAGGVTGLNRLLAFEVESLFSLFESSHQADLNIWLEGKTFNVSGAYIPKAETVLDKFRKSNAGKRSTFATTVPKSGMINSVINIDFSELDDMMKAMDQVTMDAYKEMADLRPEDIAAIEAQLKLMAKQASGDAIISVYEDRDFPMAFAAAARFKEPTKVKNAYSKIFSTLIPRVVANLGAEGGSALPEQMAKVKSIGDFLPLMNEVGGPLGIKLAALEEKSADYVLSGFKASMDWTKFAAATQLDKADPALYGVLKGVFGNEFSALLGISEKGKIGAITFGPRAMEANKALMTGVEFGGGESGIVRAAKDHIGVVSIRMDTALKAMSFIPQLASKIELIKKVPAERPMVATMNADEKAVSLHLSVPIDVMQVVGEIQN